METFIVAAILVVILGLAVRYIYMAKKSGAKCIGCPEGGCSSGSCGGCSCGCGSK